MADPMQTIAATDKGADWRLKLNDNFDARHGRDSKAVTAATYSLVSTDELLRIDATSNAVTVNLPAAATLSNRVFWLEVVNAANAITIDPSGAETVDGSATKTLSVVNRLTVLFCTGTAWVTWALDRVPVAAVADGDKGDITVSGSGATWTIDAGVVTYAKMQDVGATDKVLGRATAGAGDVEEIACTAAGRAILDDVDAAAQRTTLGVGAVGQLATLVAVVQVILDITATGVQCYVEVPHAMTITGWSVVANVSGSCVLDVWKDTYANFPPTVADTIAGTEKPTLLSAQKNQDLSLSSWTTSVAAGDWLAINVDSFSGVGRVTLSIIGTRAT